jgi:hypothetical protein
MKENSPKAKALESTLRDKHEPIFNAMNEVLSAHGQSGVKVRSFSVDDTSDCPGGAPKVPREINTPNGPITIWVCPG